MESSSPLSTPGHDQWITHGAYAPRGNPNLSHHFSRYCSRNKKRGILPPEEKRILSTNITKHYHRNPHSRSKIIPLWIIKSSLITFDSPYTPVTRLPQCHITLLQLFNDDEYTSSFINRHFSCQLCRNQWSYRRLNKWIGWGSSSGRIVMAEMVVVRMVTTPQLFDTNNWAVMVLGAFLAYRLTMYTFFL